MKLIHLADLHIGKIVNGFSMLEDQAYIFGQIEEICRTEQPDAVIIAGDVYDRQYPTVGAVELLDTFLNTLNKKLGLPVLMISGNHDSAERIGFGASLMEDSGVYVSKPYDGAVKPVVLEDEAGPVNFWLLPFVKPASVRWGHEGEEGAESINSFPSAVSYAIDAMHINKEERNVLVAHQFVTGAETSDSEELSLGTLDNVPADIFYDFDYVALGHIHKPQNMGRGIRYSGTPLKYSFSEVGQEKSVTVVELKGDKSLEVRTVPLNPLRDMRDVKGPYDAIKEEAKALGHDAALQDYVRITLTDEHEINEAANKLREFYPNLMQVRYENLRTSADNEVKGAENVQERSALDLFSELYEMQNNTTLSESQAGFLQSLIDEIWEGEE